MELVSLIKEFKNGLKRYVRIFKTPKASELVNLSGCPKKNGEKTKNRALEVAWRADMVDGQSHSGRQS